MYTVKNIAVRTGQGMIAGTIATAITTPLFASDSPPAALGIYNAAGLTGGALLGLIYGTSCSLINCCREVKNETDAHILDHLKNSAFLGVVLGLGYTALSPILGFTLPSAAGALGVGILTGGIVKVVNAGCAVSIPPDQSKDSFIKYMV